MKKCGRATWADTTNTENYNCFEFVFPRGNYLYFGGWVECGVEA